MQDFFMHATIFFSFIGREGIGTRHSLEPLNVDTMKSGNLTYQDILLVSTSQKCLHSDIPLYIVHLYTEDCKLVVRLQMQNTLGIVVIGQLDE